MQFGELPVSATTPLTPYENLKLLTPLPSSAQALIVFRGVTDRLDIADDSECRADVSPGHRRHAVPSAAVPDFGPGGDTAAEHDDGDDGADQDGAPVAGTAPARA